MSCSHATNRFESNVLQALCGHEKFEADACAGSAPSVAARGRSIAGLPRDRVFFRVPATLLYVWSNARAAVGRWRAHDDEGDEQHRDDWVTRMSTPDAHLLETLTKPGLSYSEYLRAFHEGLDVPDDVMATVCRVAPETIWAWRSGEPDAAEPSPAQAEAIKALRRICSVLIRGGFADPKGVGYWLVAGRGGLNWRAPYEVLAEDSDGFEVVLREARAFVGSAGAAPLTVS